MPRRGMPVLYAERELTDHEGRGIALAKDLLYLMGPRLTLKPDDVFLKKWESEIRKLEKIRRSVASSALEASREKEEELGRLTEQLQEVLACLQKVKR